MTTWIGLGAGVLGMWGMALGQGGGTRTWNFQGDAVSSPPVGFSFGRTG
jgi:hypothetical protein